MKELSPIDFTDGKNKLCGTWTYPKSSVECPLVILATGNSPAGSKSKTWTNLVPRFSENGIATFLFDFTGLGNSPGIYKDLTLTTGCENFRGVMKYVQKNGEYDRSKIGVIGSSYGGNVALLEAANFPEIKALGLKSPSSFLPEGYERQYGSTFMEKWGNEGFSKEVGLKYEAVRDSLFYNTYKAASKIKIPVRIVHGTNDLAVPIRQSRDLVRVLPNGTIFEIAGADHLYSKGQEWELMASDLVTFMVKTLRKTTNP